MWYRMASKSGVVTVGTARQILAPFVPKDILNTFSIDDNIGMVVLEDETYAELIRNWFTKDRSWERFSQEQSAGLSLSYWFAADGLKNIGCPDLNVESVCIIPRSHAKISRMVHEATHVIAAELFPEEKWKRAGSLQDWSGSAKEILCEAAATAAFRAVRPDADLADYLALDQEEYAAQMREVLLQTTIMPPEFLALWAGWNLSAATTNLEDMVPRCTVSAATISSLSSWNEEAEDLGLTKDQLGIMLALVKTLKEGKLPESAPQQMSKDQRYLEIIEDLMGSVDSYSRGAIDRPQIEAEISKARRRASILSPVETDAVEHAIEVVLDRLRLALVAFPSESEEGWSGWMDPDEYRTHVQKISPQQE